MRILYNGVLLNVVETQQFRSEAVYDDSGTDLLYVKHSIAVIATLAGEGSIDRSLDLISNPIANPALTGALNTGGGGLLGGLNSSTSPPPTLFGIPYPTAPGTVIEPSAQLNPIAADNGVPSAIVTTPADILRTQKGMSVGYERVTDQINHYPEREASVVGPIAAQTTPVSYSDVGLSTFGSELPLTPTNASSVPGLPVEFTHNSHGIALSLNRQIFRIVPRTVNPITTHKAIRERLLQPRGQLVVWDGFGDFGTLMLMSPEPGSATDCKNGPTPLVVEWMDAVGTHGSQYSGFAHLQFVIETYVSENVQNGVSNPRTVLSNRFSMRHTVDEESFLSIEVTGTALFRTDWVYRFQQNPDLYRPTLFMPIPNGFVRENIQVIGMPDVTGVQYSYRDRQVKASFTAGPFCKASTIHTEYRSALVSDTEVLEGALSTYERLLNIKWLRSHAKEQDKDDALPDQVNPKNKKKKPRQPPPKPKPQPIP